MEAIRQPGVVVWLGPVSAAQVKGASVPGVPTVNLTCTGDGSPNCGQIADGWLSSGRRLPGLLSGRGVDVTAQAVMGAFSAGGSAVKRILTNQQDRDQVTAVLLADATYTTTEGAPAGFVEYGVEASSPSSGKMLVATASSAPNKNWPTGAQTLEMMRQAIETRTGRSFEPVTIGTTPAPVSAMRLGNVVFADFGSKVTHPEHATKIAPQIWSSMLLPWLAGGSEPGPGPGPDDPPVGIPEPSSSKGGLANAFALLVGAVAGYCGARWYRQ